MRDREYLISSERLIVFSRSFIQFPSRDEIRRLSVILGVITCKFCNDLVFGIDIFGKQHSSVTSIILKGWLDLRGARTSIMDFLQGLC